MIGVLLEVMGNWGWRGRGRCWLWLPNEMVFMV
jgi:hypothetical protein